VATGDLQARLHDFDAWVVGYGISTLLRQLHLIESNAAFSACR